MSAYVHIDGDPAAMIGKLQVELSKETTVGALRAAEYVAGIVRQHTPRGRTGALMRSYRSTLLVEKGGEVIRAGAFSDLVYARVRDQGTGYLPGGSIRPKVKRALAIPISPEARRVGNRPGTFGDRLHLIVRKRGAPLLVEHLAKRSIIHWVLKASVKQSGSGYLEASMPEARKVAEEELGVAADLAIKRGEG